MSHAPVAARSVRLSAQATDIAHLRPTVERTELARERDDQVIVEIASAGVNPSDAKAALGLMPYAVWPRTPGRDFSGVVVDGPPEQLGLEVWGTSGDLGIRRDGTHATHVRLDVSDVQEKPSTLSLLEAGGVGVPFVTAWHGFERTGMPRPGDTVLVMGQNGKVGQASTQIATMLGARVIGVVRRAEPYVGHASAHVDVVDASTGDVAARVRSLTDGKGADIVVNTVGDPYFQAAHASLAVGGRQILMSAIHRTVPFDIFEFYRGQHTYVGIDTLAMDTGASCAILGELRSGFEDRKLRPFPVREGCVYGLTELAAAYGKVLGGTRDRVLIVPATSS